MLKKKTPLLTLAMARRLMSVLLPMRSLSVEGTMEIVEYHLHRNLVAYESHRKTKLKLAKSLNIKVAL